MGKLRYKFIFVLLSITTLTLIGSTYFSVKGFVAKQEEQLLELVTSHNVNVTAAFELVKSENLDLNTFPRRYWHSGPVKAALFGTGGSFLFGSVLEVLKKQEIIDLIEKAKDKKLIITSVLEKKDKDYILSVSPLDPEKGMYLIAFSEARNAFIMARETIKSSLTWIVILMILVFVLAIWVGHSISEPLEQLTQVSMKVGSGYFDDINIFSKRKDEIGILGQSFKTMVEKIREREKEIIESNKKLANAEKLSTLGRFSAGIAHEIKNPLGSIRGNAQLIERKLNKEPIDAEKSKELLSYITQEVDRATGIIQDILSFSTQDKLDLQPFELVEFIKEFLRIQEAQINDSGTELTTSYPSGELNVNLDKGRIDQVLGNIIANAIDAMKDRDTKKVELLVQEKNNSALIKIKDHGCGMSEEVRSHIFDPFFSTKRDNKGTGLGLSICHGIIQGHGGSILVESKEGEGTTFIIALPLRNA